MRKSKENVDILTEIVSLEREQVDRRSQGDLLSDTEDWRQQTAENRILKVDHYDGSNRRDARNALE